MGPQVFPRSHPKDRPIQSPLYDLHEELEDLFLPGSSNVNRHETSDNNNNNDNTSVKVAEKTVEI
jgi:hypothetical protein